MYTYLVSCEAHSLNIFVLIYPGRNARCKGQQSFHKICICDHVCRHMQLYILTDQTFVLESLVKINHHLEFLLGNCKHELWPKLLIQSSLIILLAFCICPIKSGPKIVVENDLNLIVKIVAKDYFPSAFDYLKERNFRGKKISRILAKFAKIKSFFDPRKCRFAKINSREIFQNWWFAKINSREIFQNWSFAKMNSYKTFQKLMKHLLD